MSLTGGKRKVNKSLKAWVAFVKKVQKEEKLSYKDAIHRAKQRKDKGEKWMTGGGTETEALAAAAKMFENNAEADEGAADAMKINAAADEGAAVVDEFDAAANEDAANVAMDVDEEMGGGRRRRRTMRRSRGRGRGRGRGRTARRARGRASRRH